MSNPVRKMVQFDQDLLTILKKMAEAAGLETDDLVNLAICDLGRKFGYIKVTPQAVPPPEGIDLLDEVELAAPPRAREPKRPKPAPARPRSSGRPANKAAQARDQTDILYFQYDDGPLTPIRKDVFLIGRGSRCDFVIQHRSVSREHAVITRERSGWFIEDLNSANSTWLDGEEIGKHKLRGGEEFQISNHSFRFTIRPG